jgi:signal transduction histidine kinase
LLLAIFPLHLFPDCFVDGSGLTAFKKGSEYLICLILLGAMALLLKERREFDPQVMGLLLWSILLTIGSELAFTFYVGVYDLSNLVGHILKILAFFLIYKALIETSLEKPFDLLYRNLKLSEERLRRRQAELEAANRELETFSYSVSHDLRAPLRSISGFSRILEEDYAACLDDQGVDYLRRVQEGAQQMAELIDALLALSRMMRAELRRQPVDLSTLARTIAETLQNAEPQRRVEFVIAPDLTVQGDIAMLRAVLENLLGNAWKFSGKVEQARIEFGTTAGDDGPVFFVRDNGAGFDMQYAQKLFLPFQRLHSVSEFPGSGVGLATVQRIIQRHGGHIWAESGPGQGATFYFTLPAD